MTQNTKLILTGLLLVSCIVAIIWLNTSSYFNIDDKEYEAGTVLSYQSNNPYEPRHDTILIISVNGDYCEYINGNGVVGNGSWFWISIYDEVENKEKIERFKDKFRDNIYILNPTETTITTIKNN